jgi:hypothetical protein
MNCAPRAEKFSIFNARERNDNGKTVNEITDKKNRKLWETLIHME